MTKQQTDIDKALVALLVDDICGDIHDNVIKKIAKKYVHKAIMLMLEFELTKFGYMPIRKRSNELAKRLMEEGEKMNREEFKELVKKGVFKDTEEDYTKFVVCKYCNYNNHNTNCCMIIPEENSKCPLLKMEEEQ